VLVCARAMVPALKRALENGRRIEQLLYEMGRSSCENIANQNPAQTARLCGLNAKRATPNPSGIARGRAHSAQERIRRH